MSVIGDPMQAPIDLRIARTDCRFMSDASTTNHAVYADHAPAGMPQPPGFGNSCVEMLDSHDYRMMPSPADYHDPRVRITYAETENFHNSLEGTCSLADIGNSPMNGYSRSPPEYTVGSHSTPSSCSFTASPLNEQSHQMSSAGTRVGGRRKGSVCKKERKRTQSINTAFAELRDRIPNVPADTKLSKIKTLRLATSYIAYLTDILADGNGRKANCAHLREELMRIEGKERNRKRESIYEGEMIVPTRGKGRTGWPQHVWALELSS